MAGTDDLRVTSLQNPSLQQQAQGVSSSNAQIQYAPNSKETPQDEFIKSDASDEQKNSNKKWLLFGGAGVLLILGGIFHKDLMRFAKGLCKATEEGGGSIGRTGDAVKPPPPVDSAPVSGNGKPVDPPPAPVKGPDELAKDGTRSAKENAQAEADRLAAERQAEQEAAAAKQAAEAAEAELKGHLDTLATQLEAKGIKLEGSTTEERLQSALKLYEEGKLEGTTFASTCMSNLLDESIATMGNHDLAAKFLERIIVNNSVKNPAFIVDEQIARLQEYYKKLGIKADSPQVQKLIQGLEAKLKELQGTDKAKADELEQVINKFKKDFGIKSEGAPVAEAAEPKLEEPNVEKPAAAPKVEEPAPRAGQNEFSDLKIDEALNISPENRKYVERELADLERFSGVKIEGETLEQKLVNAMAYSSNKLTEQIIEVERIYIERGIKLGSEKELIPRAMFLIEHFNQDPSMIKERELADKMMNLTGSVVNVLGFCKDLVDAALTAVK